jgi:hypothetical protein
MMKNAPAILIILLSTIFIIIAQSAFAQRQIEEKWREVFVTIDSKKVPVKTIDGLVLGVMEQRGFAFYEDGSVATITAWLIYESQGRNTQYSGYVLYSFRDGATQMARFEGGGDAIGKQKGNFTFIKGTGKYDGIQGSGTFTAEGFPPKADLYVDVDAQYTISKK